MAKLRSDLAARMDRELTVSEPPAASSQPRRDVPSDRPKGVGEKVYVPPSRQNMKRIQGYFSARVKRQLRIMAAEQDKTEEELVGEALNLLFQTNGLPTIAFESKDSR